MNTSGRQYPDSPLNPRMAEPHTIGADWKIVGGAVLEVDGSERLADVGIVGGTIAPVGPESDQRSPRIVDATGCLVLPGFIDMHSHVFEGQDAGVSMGAVGPPSGTTTFVDAGSAGAHLIGALRSVCDASPLDALAFLNVSSIGTTSMLLAGESSTLAYCDVSEAVDAAERHRGFVVGIKVRASGNVMGSNTPEPFLRALEVAERTGLPLMVHIGPPPPGITWMLKRLRPGDIVTHCFTGFPNRLVTQGGLVDGLAEARSRGVLLDVGHGMKGLDAKVARAAIELGVPPDTISTDIHAYSKGVVGRLDEVLTLFMGLGMAFSEVVRAVTSTPARVLGRPDLGNIEVGSAADVVILRVVNDPARLTDPEGFVVESPQQLRVLATIKRGELLFSDSRFAQERIGVAG